MSDWHNDKIKRQEAAIELMIRAWPGGKDSVSFAGVAGVVGDALAPVDWRRLGGEPPKGRCGYEQFEPDSCHTPITERQALEGVNAIRNSIVGAQTMNWSEHIYPLVSLLNRAGYEGLPYPEARANVGTLIEFREKALPLLARLLSEAKELHVEDLQGVIADTEGLLQEVGDGETG